jgi:hypothetical protein
MLDYINVWGPTYANFDLAICQNIKSACNEGHKSPGKYAELLFPSFVGEFWKDDPNWDLLGDLYGDH